jgi:hypothetical protein
MEALEARVSYRKSLAARVAAAEFFTALVG